MKRLMFLAMAVTALTFSGCSDDKDDDGGGTGNNGLVGKWEALTDHYLEDGVWVLEHTNDPGELIWEFTQDGKLIEYEEGTKMYTVTYIYNDSKKELTIAGRVCEVEKLTSTELVIIANSIDVEPVPYKTTFKKK